MTVKVFPLNRHADKLSKASTAADFAALAIAMDADLTVARKRLVELKKDEDSAIFGDGNLDDVRASIVDTEKLIETLERALEGAARRRTEAREREAIDEIEELAKAVQAKAERRLQQMA